MSTRLNTPERLDRVLIEGVAWVGSVRWIAQGVRWATTILVAKLLLPSDYGIVGMAVVVTGLVNQVAEFGLGAAVVQHRDLSRRTEEELAGVALLLAVALSLVTALSAPLVAAFYAQDALRAVIPALSVRFLFDAFATVPRGKLGRQLQFRTLALLESAESLVLAATALVVAIIWRSYWALIVANLAGGLVYALLANAVALVRPRWPREFQPLRRLLTFGRDLVLSRLAWFSYTNADFVLVGRLLSKEALGVYTLAWSIASIPGEKFASLILSVAPGVFSSARSSPGESRRLYLNMLQGISLITFPLAVGLSLVAENVVLTLLTPQWLGAVGPLRLLALFFAFRSVAALDPVILMARHEPHIDRNFNFLFVIVMPVAFLIGARWGLTGVAGAWLVVQPACSLPLQARYVWRTIDVTPAHWCRALWPAASSVTVMCLPVLLLSRVAPIERPSLMLVAQGLTGAAAYVAALWLFHRRAYSSVIQLLARFRRRGQVPPLAP